MHVYIVEGQSAWQGALVSHGKLTQGLKSSSLFPKSDNRKVMCVGMYVRTYVCTYLSISMYLSTYLHHIERYIDMMYVYVYLWKQGVLAGNACTVLEYFF